MNGYLKGCLYVILSAIIFGCMPLMAKNIYAEGVNAISLVLLRNVLAIPVLYLLLRIKKINIRPAKEGALKRIALLGLYGTVLTPALLFSSYNYISSGTATTLHFVYPVFVLLGCAVFFHDKIGLVKGCSVLLGSIGMLFFYTPGENAQFFGMALAIASGITYAAYIVYLDKSGLGNEHPFKIGFGMAVSCFFLLGPCVTLAGGLTLPKSFLGWALCLFFSIVIMVGAVVLFQMGAAIVGPQRAAILSTSEPITGIVVGIIAFGEPFGLKTALGSVLIIASVVLLTVFDKKTEQQLSAVNAERQL
ncbi:DMT family transporter [Oscillospiraceae bacterium LTW-04]|nr:DMT family transporter [Oscillospiraceae bacterium MB24-C1]